MTRTLTTAHKNIRLDDVMFVDGFAGGGGFSVGFQLATGHNMDIAVNHDMSAIRMHRTNHPQTQHYCENILNVSPKKVTLGRRVLWAHFSPDCKHFSKAKGGKPRQKKIRGLAWIVLRWAGEVKPDIVSLENVEEFKTWGPLKKGKPIKKRAGETFKKWVSQLEALGYVVEYRELVACDYGAPTSRKRLFVIARRDGKPIVWPEPTHGAPESDEVKQGLRKPWRTAASIIDWTLPCPSIFASKEEVKELYGLNAKRPLVDNTLKRVICGVEKFVLKSERPYILPMRDGKVVAATVAEVNHGGGFRGQNAHDPVHTVTGKNGYGVVEATLSPTADVNASTTEKDGVTVPLQVAIGQTGGASTRSRPIDSPVNTTVSKAETCLVAPEIVPYHGVKAGEVRGQDLRTPLQTVDAANRYGLVAPCLEKYYGSDAHGQGVDKPLATVTSKDREAVIAATLAQLHGASGAVAIEEPLPTTLSHSHDGLVMPFMSKYFAGGYEGVGVSVENPLPTTTCVDHNALVAASVVKMKGQNIGQSVEDPLQTVTASGLHFGAVVTTIVKVAPGVGLQRWPKVRELLNRFCGYTLAEDEVLLLGIDGAWYFIADIGLRMLCPRELYNANGFPVDYIIDKDYKGNTYTKTEQVARCGNAVPPPFATALVKANIPEYCIYEDHTMAELAGRVAV